MPLVKHHSKLVKASGLQLISSLFSATLSQDVLFLQPHQLQCLPLGDTLPTLVPHSFLCYSVGDNLQKAHKALLENSKTELISD